MPLAMFLVVVASCQQISYTPYDTRVPEEYANLTEKNLKQILHATRDRDEVRFVVLGDPQRALGPSADFVEEINSRDDVDFVVIAGDLTNYGVRREYQLFVDVFDELNVPYLTVVGNHDKLGKGEELYEIVFGERNYAFEAAGARFVFFDSNGLHAEDGPVNFPWLNHQINPLNGDFDQAVVLTHVPIDSRWLAPSPESRDRYEAEFTEILEEAGSVQLSIHGHRHKYEEQDYISDVFQAIIVDDPDDRNYLFVRVSGDEYETERVFY